MPHPASPTTPIVNTIMGVVRSVTPSVDGIANHSMVIRKFAIDTTYHSKSRTYGKYIIPLHRGEFATIGSQVTLSIPVTTIMKLKDGAHPRNCAITDFHLDDYVRVYQVGSDPITELLLVTVQRQPLTRDTTVVRNPLGESFYP